MTTKPKAPTPDELALLKARRELKQAMEETDEALNLLRQACGFPSRSAKRSTGSAQAQQMVRRTEALTLMTKMGYQIEDSSRKTGLVRIVGRGFDATFFDVADFDGTDANSIAKSY